MNVLTRKAYRQTMTVIAATSTRTERAPAPAITGSRNGLELSGSEVDSGTSSGPVVDAECSVKCIYNQDKYHEGLSLKRFQQSVA